MGRDPGPGPDGRFRGAGRGAIRRDAWGIPHLEAGDADALAYVQGRATALDRAWQVEVERRRGEGTLAEAIGPDGVGWDTFARSVGLADVARRAFDACGLATRRWLDAYAAGVRSGLAAGAAAAPEFEVAGGRPGRWEPWTPLAVFLVQHILFSTFPHKLWRAHVASTMGGTDGGADRRAAVAVRILGLDGDDPFGSGSNAWAVPGGLTASGLPLIAGDPHRLLEAPGIYQQVRLSCPEFDVAGLTFPGVPGVQHFGHTGEVAWAVTNAMADYQDLYVETLRRDGDRVSCREHDGTWVPAASRRELIPVHGAEPVEVEIIRTPRGPVVSGGPDGEPGGIGIGIGIANGNSLSLRTPSDVLGDLGFDALPALLRARTVKDVEAAFEAWVEPVNSVIVADATPPHGTVRRFVAGRVPDRDRSAMVLPVEVGRAAGRPDTAWRGWLPLPGADADVPVVAANERRPGDTAELGSSFAPRHRGRRIGDLLALALDVDPAGINAEHLAAVHTDTLLGGLTAVRSSLLTVDADTLAARAVAVLERLLGWDGRMDANSADAALFARWRASFVRRVAADPALAPLHTPHAHPALFAPWLDVTGRIGHAWESVLLHGDRIGIDVPAAVRGALDDTADGDEPQQWSDLHRLAPLRVEPEGAAVRPAPDTGVGGDADCVLATSSAPGRTHRVLRGPVARYVWDLADRSGGGWVVPFGASGRPGHPHALDQHPSWAEGRLLAIDAPEEGLVTDEAVVIAWSGGPLD